MRATKQVMVILTALAVAGCASVHQSNKVPVYQQQAQSIPPINVPSGMNSSTIQSDFPIPPVSNSNTAPAQPSLLPPGSQAAQQQAVKQMQQQSAAPVTSSVVNQAQTSSTSLALNVPFDQAWNKVGQALHSANYQILQQDHSMGIYYVLDVMGTGGVLKTNTPIYQVHLTANGNNTTVTLVDDKNQTADPAVSGRILGAIQQKM